MNFSRHSAFALHRARQPVLWLLCLLGIALPALANAYVLEGYHRVFNQPVVLDLQLGSPNGTLIDGAASWDQVAEAAADVWNPYLGSGVQLQTETANLVPTRGDGKNSVFFSGTVFGEDFGDDTLAVTVNHFNSRTQLAAESDVVVNAAKSFNSYRGPLRTAGTVRVLDLRRVLIHEFGHVLGLDHVPQDTVSIMTPSTANIDTIQADDIAGVEAIYGPYQPLTAPALLGSLIVYGAVDAQFTYQIIASNLSTSYQAANLPPGLKVNPETGYISGTPSLAGTYFVTIGATNSAGTTLATLKLTIVQQIKITNGPSATAYIGKPFYFQITATGQPTSYIANGLPAGLAVDSTTGLISGIPTKAGDYLFQLQAVSRGGADAATFELNVVYDATLTTIQKLPQISALLKADDGNLYGATIPDASSPGGMLFKLTPDGVLTPLYSFAPPGPFAPGDLHQAQDGSFYGTTSRGGVHDAGTVFKFTADGTMTTLVNFPRLLNDPLALPKVLQARDGNYYGSIPPFLSGSGKPGGIVYKLTPDGTLTVLYQFIGTDGFYPSALIQGSDGNFYGTTYSGGNGNFGTVFKITPDGALTTLHSFASADGAYPLAPLIQANDGNYYGTTVSGTGAAANGTVFQMTPDGALTTFHAFANAEGRNPRNALTQDSDGNFYGLTVGHWERTLDAALPAAIFKLTPDGALTTLHTFVENYGLAPFVPLIPDGAGNFYGAANGPGSTSMVFKETPTAVPLVYAPPPVVLPTVTLTALISQVTMGSGGMGEFSLELSSVQDHDVVVNLSVKGTATNGADYALLKAAKKIKAGKTSKPIKIIPQGDLGGATKKTVVLTLEPGDGYIVGTTEKVKAKIFAGP